MAPSELAALSALISAVDRAAEPGRGPDDALAGLGRIGAAREALACAEYRLVERARRAGATWAQVAGALGLASRQAAEQRWLRLGRTCGQPAGAAAGSDGSAGECQRDVDKQYGAVIVALRAAASRAYRQLDADEGWDARFPRAALVRSSLGMALDAPPGALFALVGQVCADLDGQRRPADAPGSVRPALTALRRELRRAARAAATDPSIDG